MRRLNTLTILLAALLLADPVLADLESGFPAVSEVLEKPASAAPGEPVPPKALAEQPDTVPAEDALPPPRPLTRNEICRMIEAAANGEAVPFEFFARLIWQESRFNPQAVSPAGAQGIAQFMPKTASGRGLADPFEPGLALHESAEFLHELLQKFGNVGLAAAAYNAGPKRVHDWLARRGPLPRETRNYVHIITGHPAEKWAGGEPPSSEQGAANFECNEIAKLMAERRNTAAIERVARLVVQRLAQPRDAAPPRLASQRSGRDVSNDRIAPSPARTERMAKSTARRARSEHVAEASAQPRRALRDHPAKGVAEARRTQREQVAKAVTQPRRHGKAEKIIRITARSNDRPHVEVVDVRRAGKEAGKVKPATKLAEQRRSVPEPRAGKEAGKVKPATKLAEQRRSAPETRADKTRPAAKGNKAVAERQQTKTAAVAHESKRAKGNGHATGSSNVRVAASRSASADKACAPAKGGARKSCRAA